MGLECIMHNSQRVNKKLYLKKEIDHITQVKYPYTTYIEPEESQVSSFF